MVDPPSTSAPEQVTRLLGAIADGESAAADELLPLVYGDLRKLAAARMAGLGPGQTLQATALVHEAYVRLVGSNDLAWPGRAQFFAAAARAMRNILADHLRRKGSLKRGGQYRRVGEDTAAALAADGPNDEMLALEQALAEFGKAFPRQAEVVTLSFFGGLTEVEIGEMLDVSTRTVERDWRFAKTWLNSRLADPEGPEDPA